MASTRQMQKLITLAALLLLAGCSSLRTRTFAADRDGAVDAVKILLSQEQPDALQLVLREEPAEPPAFRWRTTAHLRGDEQASGVVVIDRAETDPSLRARTYDPTPEGLLAADAFWSGGSRSRTLLLRGPYGRSHEPHAWRWFTSRADPATDIAVFESGLCVEYECADFADIRSVWLTPDPWIARGVALPVPPQSFPVNRDGALAAIAAATASKGKVSVEMSAPAGVERKAFMSTVSVLEDGRICGETYLPPLGPAERCYAYAQIVRIEVWDRNTTFADALGDAASFPFRLVGAAALATVMASAGN